MTSSDATAVTSLAGAAAGRPELAERLAFVVGSLNRRLRPSAEALTHIAVSALATIDRMGGIRPGELARAEGIAAPGMARLLGELEARGLVSRTDDPDDGRSHLVRLTDEGRAAVSEARSARAAGVAAILDEVAPGDLDTLQHAVAVLEQALLRTTPLP